MSSNNPQVVITRKDKRISHKLLHAIGFTATGGASGLVTAAEVASNASYNARTRQLQAAAPDMLSGEDAGLLAEFWARRAIEKDIPREQIQHPLTRAAYDRLIPEGPGGIQPGTDPGERKLEVTVGSYGMEDGTLTPDFVDLAVTWGVSGRAGIRLDRRDGLDQIRGLARMLAMVAGTGLADEAGK